MKSLLLLLLLLVLGVVWLWRARPRSEAHAPRRQSGAAPDPTTMLRCAGCGAHFPSTDAVRTPHGVYCCAEHRQQAEP